MLRAGEHVDFLAPLDVVETGKREYLAPLCFQQSAGDSAGPEVDVVFGVLRDLALDVDVADLDAAARS